LKLTGSAVKIVYKELPVDDPKQRQPDITKAKTILGWEPKVDRAVGLKKTYDYFKSLPAVERLKLPRDFF
jgi:dTDP-glucose 4,6-dehydratase